MSTLDVVAEILREVAPRALNARQIVELANGRLPTSSRTPETVVSRDLAIEVKRHQTRSRFLRVDRGEFVLKEALPSALFNEIEPYAAAWSRNLVAAGEIAHGIVDERSIRDLKPADVASYRQFHAFSGIGIWSRALRDAGWPDALPIWTGSAPCQPWSSAGKRGGEADARHLWPDWFRLIRACGPALVVGEQVASKDGYRWLDGVAGDFERSGYKFTATELSAAAIGAPHRRQRIYFAAVLASREEMLQVQLGEAVSRIRNGHGEGTLSTSVGMLRMRAATALAPSNGKEWEDHESTTQLPVQGDSAQLQCALSSKVPSSHTGGTRTQSSTAEESPVQSVRRGYSSGSRGRALSDHGDSLCKGSSAQSALSARGYYLRVEGDVDVASGPACRGAEAAASESGLNALHAHLENETNTAGAGSGHDHVDVETARGPDFVAYARERGHEIFSAPWLHDRGQPGHDAPGRGAIDGGVAVVLSDTAGTRSRIAEDIRSDRGDAIACAETIDRRPAGHFELERGGAPDDASALSNAECVVRDEGRGHLAHGRSEVESDRHGEADGAVELGDTSLARGGRDAGEVPGAEGAGEGERIKARDLADEPLTSGADDGGEHRFIPGDRIRIDGDPGWGGAVRGYWAEDVEWIYCRPEPGHKDGRWRPAKSGHEPLADGSAPGVGRTRAARLRCFGNAIVLPLATAFVGAVIDAFADAARANEVPTTEPAAVTEVAVQDAAWTGPREGEITPTGLLYGRLPGERWPYGPPSAHEGCCNLFPHRGSPGGLFCDCAASAADDIESGVVA